MYLDWIASYGGDAVLKPLGPFGLIIVHYYKLIFCSEVEKKLVSFSTNIVKSKISSKESRCAYRFLDPFVKTLSDVDRQSLAN